MWIFKTLSRMKYSKAYDHASIEALEVARKRRMEVVEVQEQEITLRNAPERMKISKTFSAERRLIEFITKVLSIDFAIDVPLTDWFI